LRKMISNSGSFQFPVGDAISSSRNRIGYLTITNTATTGAQIWTVQFFDKNPTSAGYNTTQLTSPTVSVVNNEYWEVIGPAGGSANVVLTWDQYTGMNSSPSIRANSGVNEWNSPVASTWNTVGNVVTDNGQNSGTVGTSVAVSLGDHIFTIGARASLVIATQSGQWTNTSTWGGIVPTAADAAQVSSGFTVTLNSNQTVTKLVIENGGTLDNTTNTLNVSGNLQLDGTWTGSGGKISLTSAGGVVYGSGSMTGTTTLELAANTSIDAAAAATLTNVSILTGVTLTNNGSVTINNLSGADATSTFTNGAGSTLYFTGASMGTFTLSAGTCSNTVFYSGTVSQTVNPVTYCNLGFQNNGPKSLGSSATVNGNVTIETGAPFTIQNSATLIFTGSDPIIDNQGTFITLGQVTHN
jgi:hypothetical protein